MLLDKFVMESLLTGTCIYRDLPEAARIKQLRNLKGFAQSQPKKLLYVVDYIENGLTPGFVSGEGPLITYAFGGIIELTAPDLVQTFKERAQAACQSGQALRDWLSANAENPPISLGRLSPL